MWKEKNKVLVSHRNENDNYRHKPRPTNYHNVYFLITAQKALVRDDSHSPEIAIVFAAMSIEVFLNDIADLLLFHPPSSKRVEHSLQLLQIAVNKRVKNEVKLLLAYFAVSGNIPQTDVGILADVLLLFKLRNLIVHSGPATVAMFDEDDNNPNFPKLVKTFISRKIIPKPKDKGSWDLYLLTPSVANWAVNTAFQFRKHFASAATNPNIRRQLKSIVDFSESMKDSATSI
jgi:hypothetical protein